MKMTSTMNTSTIETASKIETEGCIVYYLTKLLMTPHLDSHRSTDPKSEMLSAV